MEQTAITDLEEFVGVAEYVAKRGFIAEGVNRYKSFVVTLRGIDAAAGTKGRISRGPWSCILIQPRCM
jgi:hypothetical protein